jgi:hypothetical protein
MGSREIHYSLLPTFSRGIGQRRRFSYLPDGLARSTRLLSGAQPLPLSVPQLDVAAELEYAAELAAAVSELLSFPAAGSAPHAPITARPAASASTAAILFILISFHPTISVFVGGMLRPGSNAVCDDIGLCKYGLMNAHAPLPSKRCAPAVCVVGGSTTLQTAIREK